MTRSRTLRSANHSFCLSHGVSPLVVAFALLVLQGGAACGASQSEREDARIADPAPPLRADAPASGDPMEGVPYVVQAWPLNESDDDDPGALNDGDAALSAAVFRPSTDVPLPWSIVLQAQHAPRTVAAIGLSVDAEHATDDIPAIDSIAVFLYLGSVPLERANYGDFIEGSIRLGISEIEHADQWTILHLQEPRQLHYIWLRVSAPTANRPGLREVVLYSPRQLAALDTSGFDTVTLAPVDTTPYQGVDLLGLPELGASPPTPQEQLERALPPVLGSDDDEAERELVDP
ncbi:MAG: hypothetical protein ACI81R_000258 [Bradymonadia bacterium]|jgi:hypothetical protein